MTDYSRISSKIGHKHWISANTHDDGQFASDGGGKSKLSLSAPGKGKSTLMCIDAQTCRYINGSKHDFVETFATEGDCSKFKVYLETVIWRVRDFDAFSNIIPQNWYASFQKAGIPLSSVKDVHLFVHEDDDLIFYSYNHKKQPIPVANLPPIERYTDADDIMKKLHWGAINAVVEPQTYRLGYTMIQKLREKKMDQSDDEDLTEEIQKEKKKQGKSKGSRKKVAKNIMTEYERREVSPAYFWFEMIHTAMESNQLKHINFCIDEWDDIAEARSEGDVWKLIDILASDWKTLRKANISTHLSTHQTDYVDWRILKRIDYFIWMKGAVIHPAYSMINRQNIVSDLPMGTFIIEQRMISFGLDTFHKIPFSQPTVRIDGLKGQILRLSNTDANKIMNTMAEA